MKSLVSASALLQEENWKGGPLKVHERMNKSWNILRKGDAGFSNVYNIYLLEEISMYTEEDFTLCNIHLSKIPIQEVTDAQKKVELKEQK